MSGREPLVPGHDRRAVRKAVFHSVLRSVLTLGVLTVAYFVMPLQGVKTAGDIAVLVLGLIAVVALVVYQVGTIVRARYPGLRAIEALGLTAGLLLYVFAVTYVVMATESAKSFNVGSLSRLDFLYFTVTVFGTVGFGDIAAVSEAARAVVTVQILFDFVFLGVAVRVVAGAVQIGRKRVGGGT